MGYGWMSDVVQDRSRVELNCSSRPTQTTATRLMISRNRLPGLKITEPSITIIQTAVTLVDSSLNFDATSRGRRPSGGSFPLDCISSDV